MRPAFTSTPTLVRQPTPLPTRDADIVFFVGGQVVQKGELVGACVRHPLVKLRHRNDSEQKEWRSAILRELDRQGLRPDQPYDGPVVVWICFTRHPPQRREWWHPLWCTKPDFDKLGRCAVDVFEGVAYVGDSRVSDGKFEKREAAAGETPGAHIRIWLLTPDDLANLETPR